MFKYVFGPYISDLSAGNLVLPKTSLALAGPARPRR